jgi:hypothetical protein
VDVVLPEEVIGDDPMGRVDNRYRSAQREPLVALQV